MGDCALSLSLANFLKINGKSKYNNSLLTSKNDLSSVFFGGPGAGGAGFTDITSARSEANKCGLINNKLTIRNFD